MGKLGDTLRERRSALGLTLEQAEDGTRIRARLLEALETGDYERLPAPGYVRGYISSYARFLELDSIPLLNMYKAETGSGRFHELNLPQVDEAVVPRGQQHAVPWRATLGIVAAIAVLSLTVWGVARAVRGPETPAPDPVPVTEPGQNAEENTTGAVEPSGTATGTVAEPQTETVETTEPFTLVVSVESDTSWLRITIDGKKAYEGTLTDGQSKTYEVAKNTEVRIGKPSSVRVTRDGEVVEIKSGDGIGIVTLDASATTR